MILQGAEPFFLPGGKHGVLLIHGFTGLPAELLLLGESLQKQGFSVLGVRLAGHGTTVEDMSHMSWEDWMDSVRDGYAILKGFCDTVDVIGHSMGGLFALMLAAEYPIRRVVTLAAPIYIAEERGIEALPPREVCEGQFVPKARKRLKDVPWAVNNNYRKMPLVSIHELLEVIEEAKKYIGHVTSPVLIMQGTKDHTAAPRSANYIYEHVGNHASQVLWLEGMGHLLPIAEGREDVFEQVAAFLLEQ